ncbi:ABC transporter substrate-binding protein [Acidiferrimicrobium sp. IK]|uniref:ABC transporter substrate-binding protein n=1 Tax=Acidiferrimicrobium sp. IK TaxID=2871700 RepID=UPI0021CB577E|nr:ABC transporter substrate-binding protein [Acidiferrimicrobium sp. IK]MCU4186693.1 ABC transporter substrate-binding protein [Acidiferrimicrobium sp. IK]
MFRTNRRTKCLAIATAALAAAASACGSSSTTTSKPAAAASSSGSTAAAGSTKLTTVTMMVGGIDKQIYLEYQLGYDLGFFKKHGINMVLSTEQQGGVGAEDAMASGQVDLAGAWYIHTIDFQQKGKDVIDLAQLAGAPGERIMCANGSGVHTAADFKGKSIGVTDLGSGTDDLVLYLAARAGLTTKDFSRIGVGAGSTLISALQNHRIACGITSQPTVNAIESKGIGYSAIDLATTTGTVQNLGGAYPAAGVLTLQSWVDSHPQAAQNVVTAMVETMHWIGTHTAADVANNLPAQFVSNALSSKADYVKALTTDYGQFIPTAIMPASGPQTALNLDKIAGNITKPVDLSKTYTNQYVQNADKVLGYSS